MKKILLRVIVTIGIIFIPVIMSGTDIFEAAKSGDIDAIKDYIKSEEMLILRIISTEQL